MIPFFPWVHQTPPTNREPSPWGDALLIVIGALAGLLLGFGLIALAVWGQ